MKFSPLVFVGNLFIVIVSILIMLPNIQTEFLGRKVNIPAALPEQICLNIEVDDETGEQVKSNCFPNTYFENSGDFRQRRLLTFDFIELNDSTNEIFARNVKILKQRIDLLSIQDYELIALKGDDGSYQVEIAYFEDDQEKIYAFQLLASRGELKIYHDDPNFSETEDDDEQMQMPNTDFLEGKIESDVLSIKDVKRASATFDSALINGMGAFALRLDFGNENIDKVMQVAQTLNVNVARPGIQLVMDTFPVAEQAEHIRPLDIGYDGQSYIKFIPYSNPYSEIQTKALRSIVQTRPIDTQIQISDITTISPRFDMFSIDNLKLMIPFGFLMSVLLSVTLFKRKGVLFSLLIGLQMIFGFAFFKFFNVFFNMRLALNSGIIIGYIGIFMLLGFVMMYFIQNIKEYKNIQDNHKELKNIYYIIIGIIISLDIFYIFFEVASSSILSVALIGINMFLISFLYVIDVGFNALAPIKFFYKSDKNLE